MEDGRGAILSYHRDGGTWVRSIVRQNPDPTGINYSSMIVVPANIDNYGDEDLALSGAFGSSSVGSWMGRLRLDSHPAGRPEPGRL